MIVRLQLEASAYCAKNRAAIIELRAFVQDIYSRFVLVSPGLKIFTRRHVEEAMRHLSTTFKD